MESRLVLLKLRCWWAPHFPDLWKLHFCVLHFPLTSLDVFAVPQTFPHSLGIELWSLALHTSAPTLVLWCTSRCYSGLPNNLHRHSAVQYKLKLGVQTYSGPPDEWHTFNSVLCTLISTLIDCYHHCSFRSTSGLPIQVYVMPRDSSSLIQQFTRAPAHNHNQ